jgi:hypothetical protein
MSIRVFLALVLLLIVITFQIGFAQPAASWVEVGAGSATFPGGVGPNDNAQWPSLAIAPDGTPYVAYSAYVNNTQNEVYVRKFDGTSWVEVGAGSASGGGISNDPMNSDGVRIAIAPDGTPYVAWHQFEFGAPASEIYIKKFNGSTWVEVGTGSATDGGISNTPSSYSSMASLAIAPDGTVYIAWHESSSSSGIYVRKFNGTSWIEVGAGSASGGGVSEGYGFATSLAIGSDGLPVVAYESSGSGVNSKIYVRRFDGSAWVEMGVGSASGVGISNSTTGASINPSLVFAPDGAAYVAWSESLSGSSQIYVRRFDGTSWVEAGAGSATGTGISNYPPLDLPFQPNRPSTKVDAMGIVYIAWEYYTESTDYVIHARRFNGAIWEEIPTGSASGAGVISGNSRGIAPSLAINPFTNLPYIAWFAAEFPPSWVIGVFVRRLDRIPPTPLPPTSTPLPPTLTTLSLPDGMVSMNYQQALTVSAGTQPYTFSVVQGALPAGLSLHSRSGIISGIPTQAGSFTVTLQVVDTVGRSSAQTYTIVVAPAAVLPLTLSPSALPAGAVGVPYQAVISAQGGTGSGYTYAIISGALPPGLSLNAFGVISGTPVALGSTTFTIIALDSGGNTGSATFTLTIAPPDALAGH